MSSHSQSLYKPNRLIHIKLEGPEVATLPDKLHLTSSETLSVSSPLFENTKNRGQNIRLPDQYRNGPPIGRIAPHRSLPKRGESTVCRLQSRFRNWDGNTPFYLSLINQDSNSISNHSSSNDTRNPIHKTAKASRHGGGGGAGSGGGSNNNNRAMCMLSGRRLHQLISMTSLTSLAEWSNDEDDDQFSKKTINPPPSALSSAKVPVFKSENWNDTNPNQSPYPRTFLHYLETPPADMPVAKLCTSAENNLVSNCSSEEDPLPVLQAPERSDKERWACQRTIIAPHGLKHLRMIMPIDPRLALARDPFEMEEETETQEKEMKNRHSKVWDSILSRRNPKHDKMSSQKKVRKPNASSTKVVSERNASNQNVPKPENILKSGSEKQVNQTAKDKRGSSDTKTGSTSVKQHENMQKANRRNCSPVKNIAREKKINRNMDAKDCSSLQRTRRKLSLNPSLSKQKQMKFEDMRKLAPHESPPEIIYPPYFKPEKEENVKRKRVIPTLREQKNQQKRANSRNVCQTACKFWQSLVDDDTISNKDDRLLNMTICREPCLSNVVLESEEVGQAEVAPAEVIQNCQIKGYEILRRLSRGKFRENISLYLASNEGNPKFSPVEIIVVAFPSRSCARSFLQTSFAGSSAARKPQGFACRPSPSNLLPPHTNLLSRLHVFSSGSCVYQVSNYCSWPTLASLLQPSTPESPPTASSHNSSPNRKHRYHGASPERQIRPFDVHDCHNSNHAHLSSGNTFFSLNHPSLDAHNLNVKAHGKKQVGFYGCDRYIGVGSCAEGKFQEKTGPIQTGGAVKLEESASKIIFRQICEGLKHLHDHGLLHSDLNCSNVLVTDKLEVKLTGYGPCCLHTPWESSPGESCAPPLADPYDVYIPPEIMTRRSYGGWAKSSDIWCLGMTLLHMALGEVNPQVNCAVRLRRSKQFKTLCLDNLGYQLGLLLELLLQLKAIDRPSVDAVLDHAWLSDGTDLASEIDRHAQHVTMRTDGRTFPLPKRIRQAFSSSGGDLTWEQGGAESGFLLASSQWSCQEDDDNNDDGSVDCCEDNSEGDMANETSTSIDITISGSGDAKKKCKQPEKARSFSLTHNDSDSQTAEPSSTSCRDHEGTCTPSSSARPNDAGYLSPQKSESDSDTLVYTLSPNPSDSSHARTSLSDSSIRAK